MTKYFTAEEAERLIPELTRRMGRLMTLHAEVSRIRSALREERRRIMAAGGGLLDQATWRDRTARVERLQRDMEGGLAAIAELGGETKDLGIGLVDFRHLMGGREVNLCWRFGEPKIAFWHGLEEGYSSRKPLNRET